MLPLHCAVTTLNLPVRLRLPGSGYGVADAYQSQTLIEAISAFAASEHLGTAGGTDALSCRFAVLHGYGLGPFMSLLARHFMQYASTAHLLSVKRVPFVPTVYDWWLRMSSERPLSSPETDTCPARSVPQRNP